ncbi:Histidine kinase-, DNA gyrase B-, and HSP90-like ATPase [Malonomonas rubra DSM 5091]|uniref:histidine kinase n=1 Tax=Malonomonas rubra DSM 5091 TaxID=1122189 RepID=A0A1M6FHH1_MALRU|nr:HAMP domain-containing protein [Malonomonas rubra]SHI97103.1 Histidine kinase-, DNA gyrase B-, and HSP90-like ATPase [Malonomonas rubra DSM 5091]
MRITIKQQVLLAPATVLLLLILLLGFMHYTYWDLSSKREQAKQIGNTFVAVAEADMAARRLHVLIRTLQHTGMATPEDMALVTDLYDRLASAVDRIEPFGPLKETNDVDELQRLVEKLNPSISVEPELTAELFAHFRGRLSNLSNTTQLHRNKLRHLHSQDINTLMEHTVLVSISVLVLAILLCLLIATYFSRRIMVRIQKLSDNAGRIAAGDLELPPAPKRINDELDALALSINRMTNRLIQVVGTEKLLEGAEEERRRIAMDLHDQSLADLSSVLRGLQNLSAKAPDQQTEHSVITLEQDLDRAITNLRDIMNNLHPQALDILGLGAAIEAHLDQHCFREGLPEYNLYIDPRSSDLDLSRVQKLSIYRIALEAIQNVLKHAAASRYEVNLEVRDKLLVMSVEDNGKGFDCNRVSDGGRGLNNIRERARAIGADVSWQPSRFSSGTRFELALPTT